MRRMLTGTLVLHPAFYLNVLPDKTCQNKPVPFWQVERRGLLVNILVLLPVNDRHRAILESSAPGEDFIYTSSDAATREQIADADVILGNIDPGMLTACEHLQLLQLQTAGYDDYLAAGTVPADAKLSCSVGAYGQAVSEHMFAMVLSMMKRLPGYHDLQREHRWEDLGPVTSLKNANVLVLGAGDIGGHFATLCRNMGAHVRGIKRHPLVYPIVFEDMDGMDALPERLAEADIVTSFMPSTPETRGLANAEFFAAMKPGAFFANGGRGDLVVADDLVAALESGHLAGAAVDVTDPEPLPETSHCGMRPTCSSRHTSPAGSTWQPRSTMWSTSPRRTCVTCKPAKLYVVGSNIRFRRSNERRTGRRCAPPRATICHSKGKA